MLKTISGFFFILGQIYKLAPTRALHLYRQRHTHEGIWGLNPPPYISKIYGFQEVFRPQRLASPRHMESKKN